MTARKIFTHPIGMMGAAIVVTFLWGSALPFIKLSYTALDIGGNDVGEQLLFAGYRFILAGIFVLVFAWIRKRNIRFRLETLPTIVKLGMFQTFIQYVCFYIGLSLSTGVQGSIIAGTASFFQIIFAHFMYNDDKMNMRKGIGLVIGFTGVILVNISKGSFSFDFGIGEFLILCSAAAGGFGNLVAKNAAQKVDIAYSTGYQMLFGAILLTAIGSSQVGFMPFHFNLISFMMLVYLALVSAVGFLMWNNIMKYNKVGKVSLFLFFVPVFGTVLSGLMLGESLQGFVLVGMCCVAIGIIIVNRKKELTMDVSKKVS